LLSYEEQVFFAVLLDYEKSQESPLGLPGDERPKLYVRANAQPGFSL
jgi:hypothetical protein